jgi:hypothetical protein
MEIVCSCINSPHTNHIWLRTVSEGWHIVAYWHVDIYLIVLLKSKIVEDYKW